MSFNLLSLSVLPVSWRDTYEQERVKKDKETEDPEMSVQEVIQMTVKDIRDIIVVVKGNLFTVVKI
ncbi:hypothetical protein EON63_16865 [archaeon]|nr:MAG: hypothetical protein EON63_16865 [archaeon]